VFVSVTISYILEMNIVLETMMAFKYILACVVILCPLVCQAGQVQDNKSEEEWHKAQLDNYQKQQYNNFQKQEYEKWEKHRFFQYQQQLLADKAKNHNEQLMGVLSNFVQAAEHEMRGVQDPAHKQHIMQQFQQKKAAQERHLHEEHQRFLHEEKNKMQAEQKHHLGWLQNMLMNQEGGRTMLRHNPSGRQHEL